MDGILKQLRKIWVGAAVSGFSSLTIAARIRRIASSDPLWGSWTGGLVLLQDTRSSRNSRAEGVTFKWDALLPDLLKIIWASEYYNVVQSKKCQRWKSQTQQGSLGASPWGPRPLRHLQRKISLLEIWTMLCWRCLIGKLTPPIWQVLKGLLPQRTSKQEQRN